MLNKNLTKFLFLSEFHSVYFFLLDSKINPHCPCKIIEVTFATIPKGPWNKWLVVCQICN